MAQAPVIRAAVTFLSREEGGRAVVPDLSSRQYVPHLVVQPAHVRVAKVIQGNVCVEDYLGVRFISGGQPLPGQSTECELELMYHPQVNYEGLREGATFTIREGAKVVGFGRVTPSVGTQSKTKEPI